MSISKQSQMESDAQLRLLSLWPHLASAYTSNINLSIPVTILRKESRTVTEQAVTSKAVAEVILDVRPDLERGGEPFVRIMETVSTLQPGKTLVIIAPFEPIPLYDVLGARGFSHETAMVGGDEWVVRFFLA